MKRCRRDLRHFGFQLRVENRFARHARRFHASGSGEDEVAWLTERLRVGELTQDRVELAACLGHEAASAVMPPEYEPDWGDWVYRLAMGEWGRESSLRTYVSLGELTTLVVGREPWEAALAWVLCRCNKERPCRVCTEATEVHEDSWDTVLHSWADPISAAGMLRYRSGLRDDLVPWAFGYSDPLRERAEARRRERGR